jgi:hypothetical protein
MNDRELLEEFVRVERTESRVRILVREIRWDGPHTPVSTWAISQDLPATATKAEADAAATSVLDDPQYFRTCLECGDRKPVGWMLDESTCQECAQTKHGIVY